MNREEISKIRAFVNDKSMSRVIYGVLMSQFTKPRKDYSFEDKASAWIAIQRLQDAWRELESQASTAEEVKEVSHQVGM